MTTNNQGSTPHYWYGPEAERQRAVAVLEAMRAYGAADAAMQRRSEHAMRMSENDISALRYLLRAHERGVSVGPKELADYLGVQSSSITILLDRLEKAGHVRREPSPFDRRALIIVPTVPTDQLHKAILGDIREELIDVASTLSAEDADTVVEFIDRLRDAVDHIDSRDTSTNVSSRSTSPSSAGRENR